MKLSSIISDGMVIQRNKQVTISGNTKHFQKVCLTFLEKSYETTSDSNGDWSINLENLEPGGPYHMEIVAEEKIVIQDILIGDVWVLGGQSNMQLPINRTLDLFSDEIKDANEPFIRQFSVPQNYNFHKPEQYLVGGTWTSATHPDVMNFSAVGYFFAKELYEKYCVPIGLIQTAVGGTPIEAWISEKTLRKIGGYDADLDYCKNDFHIAEKKRSDEERHDLWYKNLNAKDPGLKDISWYDSTMNVDDWDEFEIPNSWKDSNLENIRGSVWFRKEFNLPSSMLENEAKLVLGTIIDADETYINGTCIGTTGYKYPPRRYLIPEGLLKSGTNSITVRVISTQTTGGFVKGMPYKLIANGKELNLQGTWKYRIGAITETLEPPTFFQYKPAGVYNGMIAPLGNYCMKGVLWYQGESNTQHPKGYSRLFNALMNDWRENWKSDAVPFIYTQLANFETSDTNPDEANWAVLREEQRLALNTSNTAMAVAIDIGEYNDLHPQDKKTLGKRLALGAINKAYHEDIVYSGPQYKRMEHIGNSIHLSFDHVGSGLTARDGNLKYFTICGTDGKFVPANAFLRDNKVIVSHEQIKDPCHVRYAWLDNPEGANLYNKEGLPASPFTTESK
ncbi:sialate O-acetylesterase [Halalkalibacter urbisdiaboli]|uniref:sialate O-acetylesterase n=1 Tax=Halalkalibacter urbisdiaboli TaxID=1960589 RepID=UPI000B4399CF|nr:sialate O-acetylesterase [Halalkalibacter urbisdiaboli]